MMALSLAGLLASLSGCEKAPVREDTRHLENPPPKPPNCPDLPELKNITLNDGAVADVRIVQFRDTKLYFPTQWLRETKFVDKGEGNDSGFIKKGYLGQFTPDIHSEECPGVVHQIADETAHLKGVYPVIPLQVSGRGTDPQFESTDFRALDFGLNSEITAPHMKFIIGLTQKIKFNKDIVIRLHRAGSLERGVDYESQSILDLTEWLMTPPGNRDNDRKFALKIDRVISHE